MHRNYFQLSLEPRTPTWAESATLNTLRGELKPGQMEGSLTRTGTHRHTCAHTHTHMHACTHTSQYTSYSSPF